MKKAIIMILLGILALALCLGAAAAEETILGQPFPDFTATDTEGNTFTLSEALKDHEAVLINCWATWCPPCVGEFPELDAAYKKYGDRVAFIALSCEEADTNEVIAEFRESNGITFPMARDEGRAVYGYTRSAYIPVTVVVDRFGNAGFMQVSAFQSAEEIGRVLDAFLGEGYTKTRVLNSIPKDTGTAAFPVAAKRAVRVENENVKTALLQVEGVDSLTCIYIVPEDTARLRLEITVGDDPSEMYFYDHGQGRWPLLSELLDPALGAYTYELGVPRDENSTHYNYGLLVSQLMESDPDSVEFFLVRDEAYIGEILDYVRSLGYEQASWEYAEPAAEETAVQAYILHFVDQYGDAVPGVYVNFCTDTACTMVTGDETGAAAFEGEPDVYHIQLLKVPEGYSFDAAFELYVGKAYGEWVVQIRKD